MSAPDVTPYKDVVGWLYVTPAPGPPNNTYGTLSPYLADIARQLSAINPPCIWAVVGSAGGTPLPSLSSSCWLKSPLSVSDSLKGAGYASIQQNVCGQTYGFQNVVLLQPDSLVWRMQIFGPKTPGAAWESLITWNDQLQDLNITDLQNDLALLQFGVINTPGLFASTLKIGTNGENPYYDLKRAIPASFEDQFITGYLTMGGWNLSNAVFTSCSAEVEHTSDPSITDLTVWPWNAVAPPKLFTTNEASNTNQTVTVQSGSQVTVNIGIGSGLPS